MKRILAPIVLVVIIGLLVAAGAAAADNAGTTTADDEDAENVSVDLDGVEAEMFRLGAWHPDDNEPAVMVVREQDPHEDDPDERYGVFYYVGPNNGEVSFHGRSSWDPLPLQEIGDGPFPPIRVDLPYAPIGVESQYEFQNSEAPIVLRQVERDINNKAEEAFIAWADWNNDQRHSAETRDSRSLWAAFGLLVLGMYGAARVEARKDYFKNKDQEKELDWVRGRLGWKVKIVRVIIQIPIIGWVVRWVLK